MKIYESLTKAEPPKQEHVIELNNVLGGENNIICKLLKLQIFSGLLFFCLFPFPIYKIPIIPKFPRGILLFLEKVTLWGSTMSSYF